MENSKKGKKYVLRRFFIYCHLAMSFAFLLGEIASGFQYISLYYYSLNFRENFVRKKFYYIKNVSLSTDTPQIITVYGFLENNIEKVNTFRLHKDDYWQNVEKDEQGRFWLEVWYCPKQDYIYSIKSEHIFYEGLRNYLIFIIWIIPEIWYLIILRRREKRAKLLKKNI